jgi:hypothetical protein
MSEVTYYVALPFVLSDDGVAAAEAIECFNPNAAVMKAEALSRKRARKDTSAPLPSAAAGIPRPATSATP